VCHQLESAGHVVEVADDGLAAVELCRTRDAFDLVLMDQQMPGLGGLDATTTIRALGAPYDEVPILAMTASAEESTRDVCLRVGMNDVVVKPVRHDDLLRRVDEWLAPRPSAAPVAATPAAATAAPVYADENDAPVDLEKALEQLAGNRPLRERTLRAFVEQTRADLGRMGEHLAAGDRESLRQDAHKVRGAAAYLAARPLARAASDVEHAALEGRCTAADLRRLGDELERLHAVVAALS
jgi:CheY-like chemotaxis protein/HPt (histidine-containing phosphotransfer) domain-containing protein